MESSVQELIAATQNAEKDLRLIIAEMRGDGNGIAPSILIDGWANELERIYIALGSVNAFPLRNCDVGTAEEQTTRYRKFCSDHKYLSSDFSYICKGFGKGRCPFSGAHTKSQCEFAWAQMPYKEGGAE